STRLRSPRRPTARQASTSSPQDGSVRLADTSKSTSMRKEQRTNQLSIQQYVDAILPPLRELKLRILLEPGRLLVGNAGVLLTRVRYIKQTGQKKFAIVDAGMNDLIRPALYHSYHEIVPCKASSAGDAGQGKNKNPTEKIDIVGPVCE